MTADDIVSIASESISADINPLGAELFALRDGAGRDLLWNGDPAIWKGRAPLLFPIVGALANGQYRSGDNIYRLPRHGFARNRHFQLVEASAAKALFRLGADDESFQNYPFAFQLDVAFSLRRSSLTMAATIRNLGEAEMPASFGFHPALRWPLPYGKNRADHLIRFDQEEPSPLCRLGDDGLILPEHFPTPIAGKALVLSDDLFARDALIFDHLASRRLHYGAQDGPQIDITFDGMPYLGLWTKPGANFICIEPWHGLADPQGFDGDVRGKPGIFLVPPGAVQCCTMAITLENQGSSLS